MSWGFVSSVMAIALLQGALVALPRHDALMRIKSVRSPAWALLLPGLFVIGTFGLVLVPSGAIDLVTFAAFATPLLAMLAAVAVVRRHLTAAAVLLIAGAGVVAVLGTGPLQGVAASLVTACGAMLVAAVIVRLLPGRTLLLAIVAMCLMDVVLMSFGVGRSSSHLFDMAARLFQGPRFDEARVGQITTEYPDLLLAAMIGAVVAGRPSQRWTALLVVLCVPLYDLLMLFLPTVPATPPLLAARLLAPLTQRSNRDALSAALRRRSFSRVALPGRGPQAAAAQ